MTDPAGAGLGGAGGRGAAPWLAVIDMQRVFGEPGSPWLAPRFAEIVDPVRRLAEAFGPRVVFTRFVAPERPHGAWRQYYDQWPFALQPPDARIYELADPFAGMAGPTLDATTFSKWGPDLAARTGGGPLVLAGVSTDCCVLSTAVGAADAGGKRAGRRRRVRRGERREPRQRAARHEPVRPARGGGHPGRHSRRGQAVSGLIRPVPGIVIMTLMGLQPHQSHDHDDGR